MKNRYLKDLKDMRERVFQHLNNDTDYRDSKEFQRSLDDYISYMHTLANYCFEVNNSYEEIIDIHKEHLDALSKLYKKNKRYFFKYYYNSLNYHLILLKETYDVKDDVDIHKEILKIVNRHIRFGMSNNFDEIYGGSLEKKIFALENLVDSLQKNKLYEDSVSHHEELNIILEDQYIENYNKLMKNLNNYGNIALQLKKFEEAFSSYEKYFIVLNINISIKSTNDFWKIVYTFVKYYQASIHLDKDLDKLDFQIKNLLYQLKLIFSKDYESQIEKYYLEYLKAKDSKDEFTQEKYSIFMKLFKGN